MSFPVVEATVGFSPAPAHTKGGAAFHRGAGIGSRLCQPGAAGAGTRPSPISSATNSSPEPPPRFSKTLIRSVLATHTTLIERLNRMAASTRGISWPLEPPRCCPHRSLPTPRGRLGSARRQVGCGVALPVADS